MTPPRRLDSVDLACQQWAAVKRELLGVTQPALSRGFLGPLRCTLAARRDLHHGGRSGKVEQQFPEFPYLPGTDAWVVNQAVNLMAEPLVDIMVAHYVAMKPRDKRLRADLLGLTRSKYWDRVARAKEFVGGALAISKSVRTLSPSGQGINRTIAS